MKSSVEWLFDEKCYISFFQFLWNIYPIMCGTFLYFFLWCNRRELISKRYQTYQGEKDIYVVNAEQAFGNSYWFHPINIAVSRISS